MVVITQPAASLNFECYASHKPAGGLSHLLTTSRAGKQSFEPGPEHLHDINTSSHPCELIQLFVFLPQDNRTQTCSPDSPLRAVLVTRLAVALPVGVFEDQAPLAVIHSSRTRRHAVGTVSEPGAGHALVGSLFRKKKQ